MAQSFCLLVGAALIAVGILGLIFGGSGFDSGGDVQGDDFIIFEVNGWHNVLHIASGAFLVLMSMRAPAAIIGALIFGVVYAGIAVWGFAEEDEVADLVATDTADNWLHVGLAAAGLLVGLVAGALGRSARREHRRLETAVTEEPAHGTTATATESRRRWGFFRRRRKEGRAEPESSERERDRTTEPGRRE
jgi:Domain of unknown function (DUF4383)